MAGEILLIVSGTRIIASMRPEHNGPGNLGYRVLREPDRLQ